MDERPGISETIAGDIARGNTTARREECPVDRIGALAMATRSGSASPLGAALKRLRAATPNTNGYTTHDFRPVIRTLEYELQEGREKALAERLGSCDRFFLLYIAVFEWLHQRCQVCHGRKFMRIPGEPQIDCLACGATGFQRHTDADRERVFGSRLNSDHARFLTLAAQEITFHDSTADQAVKRKLGRG